MGAVLSNSKRFEVISRSDKEYYCILFVGMFIYGPFSNKENAELEGKKRVWEQDAYYSRMCGDPPPYIPEDLKHLELDPYSYNG